MPTVIGFGNVLRGDDGVGPAVVDLVAARNADVRTLVVPLLVPELAPELAEASVVIFVDARQGLTPGTLRMEPLTAEGSMGAFGHLLSPGSLLALTRRLYGRCPAAFHVTIDANRFDIGSELSPAVVEAIPVAADAVLEILRRSGQRAAGSRQ